MNKRKTRIVSWLFMGFGIISWAQVIVDAPALELTKLLHKEKVEQTMQSQPGVAVDSASVSLNDNEYNKIYKSISEKYKQRFKPAELKELTTFYTSSIGKKLLKEYPLMMADANTIISKWEMKQMGIEDISIDETPILIDEEELTLEVIDTIVPQPKVKPIKKEAIAVKTLQQLQALLKDKPDLIYDPIELSKILNISLESEIIDEPDLESNLEIENNKPIKN